MITNTPFPQPHITERLLSRSDLLVILNKAISLGAVRIARQAALSWLANFPGDLPVSLLYARVLVLSGKAGSAIPVLENLCLLDPEYLEAYELLSTISQAQTIELNLDAQGSIFALSGNPTPKKPIPAWAERIRLARLCIAQGEMDTAEQIVHQVIGTGSLNLLVAATHLLVSEHRGLPAPAIRDLAEHYRRRWPGCLIFNLRLAASLIDCGENETAVALLHQSVAQDTTAQVATRLWGEDHPYKSLWPARLAIQLDFPIPAEVAEALGWNRLPTPLPDFSPITEKAELPTDSLLPVEMTMPQSDVPAAIESEPENAATRPTPAMPEGDTHEIPTRGAQPAPSFPPESILSVQKELERVAARLKVNFLARTDGRFPIYVVFTTRQGLIKKYGPQAVAIEAEMIRLVATISARRDWGALLVYADDPIVTKKLKVKPARPTDPWELKLVLADLDASLARQGQMIGAVLIVGGPEVVPFHLLPNPVDDADDDVPSDNPYSTHDENYFIPEWPVGRLPGEAAINGNSSPDLLMRTLREITARHSRFQKDMPWYWQIWERLTIWLWRQPFLNLKHRTRLSCGYTAAAWRRASLSVYRPIGEPHTLLVSPPVQSLEINGRSRKNDVSPTARLGYFNLHGLQDSSAWYGQRDPADPASEPDYPVALRPQDILNSGRAPLVVFSEACYGANVLNKGVEQALALKFLSSGCQAVIGSTCTAYGSITTPLIAADLLGNAFWKFLRDGLPTGEALRRAKITLAREMHRRQGYLDGEDQKTLISFVLYGDPLVQLSRHESHQKAILRPLVHPAAVKTVCDRYVSKSVDTGCPPAGEVDQISPETLDQVKRLVKQYLPGMSDAHFTYCHEQAGCLGVDHSCPTSQLGSKTRPAKAPERSVVTLSKQVEIPRSENMPALVHHHYARLTLDGRGKVIKLAVSR